MVEVFMRRPRRNINVQQSGQKVALLCSKGDWREGGKNLLPWLLDQSELGTNAVMDFGNEDKRSDEETVVGVRAEPPTVRCGTDGVSCVFERHVLHQGCQT